MKNKNIKYKIFPSKEGAPTLSVSFEGKTFPLHSRFYPTKEKGSLNNRFNHEKYDLVIVLGIGLGYHLLPLEKNIARFKKIILIDILNNIEKEIGRNNLTSFLTKNKNINFITGENESIIGKDLSRLIDINNLKGITVVEHPPSMKVFGDYYSGVKILIEKLINRKTGSRAAKKNFGALYLKNILKNLHPCNALFPVKGLFGLFGDYPSIIVTSGPSLEKNLSLIKEKQNNFFIIAVDSALPVLIGNKIKPDFFISIDPQPYIAEHFMGLNLSNTVPVFSLSASSPALNKFQCFISTNSHPLCQLVDELFPGLIGSIDSSTGTVAGDAVSLSNKLGFKPAALAGFDFSFTSYKIYSKGSAYQKRYSIFFQNRLSTIEKFNIDYILKSSGGYKYSGKFSRKSFIQYKESLENFIKENQLRNILNINSGEVEIAGAPVINMETFLDNFCEKIIQKNEIIGGILSKIELLKPGKILQDIDKIFDNDEILKKVIDASIDKGGRMVDKAMIRKLIKN